MKIRRIGVVCGVENGCAMLVDDGGGVDGVDGQALYVIELDSHMAYVIACDGRAIECKHTALRPAWG